VCVFVVDDSYSAGFVGDGELGDVGSDAAAVAVAVAVAVGVADGIAVAVRTDGDAGCVDED